MCEEILVPDVNLMIIRKCTTKTVKPSQLSNRGCERSEHPRSAGAYSGCTLRECPGSLLGDPFGVVIYLSMLSGGTAHPRLLIGDRFAVLMVVHSRIIINLLWIIISLCVNEPIVSGGVRMRPFAYGVNPLGAYGNSPREVS